MDYDRYYRVYFVDPVTCTRGPGKSTHTKDKVKAPLIADQWLEEIDYIKDKVFTYCHWSDKVMNRFEDLFNHLDFTEDTVLELRGTILSTKPPKLELKQIQRKPDES